ncbi:MAG: hypothetical protein JW893_07860 [Candidatus Omnitrophica bacterium]|nr:hypothetical protein [Candidatus Omnitrophota bacterium]
MKKPNQTHRYTQSLFLTLFVLFAIFSLPATFALAEEAISYDILDAGQREVVTVGDSKGLMIPSYDAINERDIVEFDYTLSENSSASLVARDFPAALSADTIDSVKIGVETLDAEQVNQIAVEAKLKGDKGIQNIPLAIKRGWKSLEASIDWKNIGSLREITFTVATKNDTLSAKGTVSFAVLFEKKSPADQAKTGPNIPTSFGLLSSRERGVSGEGGAEGSLLPTFDQVVGKDILEVDYSIPQGGRLNVWSKSFHTALDANTADTARVGIRAFDSKQIKDVAVNLELKGTIGKQTTPLNLKPGWNSFQETVDWVSVGALKEVCFTLAPQKGSGLVHGTLSFALQFVKGNSADQISSESQSFTPSFSIMDAGVRGMFNIGDAQGVIGVVFDEIVGKDVLSFDYSAPSGTHVGIWTQEYPAELSPESADAVRIGVMVPTAAQVDEVAVKVEIKGETSWQTIPLELKPGWNSVLESINWSMVGHLKEAVFVVSPVGQGPTILSPMGGSPVAVSRAEENDLLAGTLYFDLEFGKLSLLQKYFTFVKIGLLLLLSLLLAFFVAILKRNFGKNGAEEFQSFRRRDAELDTPGDSRSLKLRWDLFYGTVAVLIVGVAIKIYSLGTIGYLDDGLNFTFLAVALTGAVIAALLKYKHTGKHLSPSEIFQNVLITGLLAASSTKQDLLQAPATWSQLFMIANLTATIVFLIYHISNACSLASSGKHLKPLTGALITITPYLFGWLLLLENSNLLQTIASVLTFGLLASWPIANEIFGRFIVVLVFNEVFTNGISMATKGKLVRTAKAHWVILLVSLGVVVAPWIADLGSSEAAASLPGMLPALAAILATILSYGGLWGEVYLITGIALDGGHRTAPSNESISQHVWIGTKKGMAYSGILLSLLFLLYMLLNSPAAQAVMNAMPLLVGILSGALLFPLIKTIIETFDGSQPFFERTAYSYRDKTLYARGAVIGFGFAYMITQNMFQLAMSDRISFGLMIGLLASSGVSLLRDIVYAIRGEGRVQSWRLYLTDGLLGAFVGSAAAFYLDTRQIPVVIQKFKLYTSAGFDAVEYITYPLVNKWGRIDLGTYTGGAKLLFTESLAGVINWAVAAWLFAINKVFLQAYFDKDTTPIKFFFSKAGFATLIEHMIYVLRWGLWMSPIIFTFLRMMPDPTWYNQDGAIRTLFAIYNNATMSSEAFREWSLNFFIYILAFDFLRILIWMDHMGLRVATLVNLSFIGLDKLDEKIARFIGPAAAQRYIPEGVKRFATWAPLLIPFYLPRGKEWDFAWNASEAIQNGSRGGFLEMLQSLSFGQMVGLVISAILISAGISFVIRLLVRRGRRRRLACFELGNRDYKVVVKENGDIYSEVYHKKSTVYPPEYDVTRKSYDMIDPCGRILFFAEAKNGQKESSVTWPVIGNFPHDEFEAPRIEKGEDSLRIMNTYNGVKTIIEITLPGEESTAEIWAITIENLTHKARELKVVPYVEWVLNGGLHDRFHTQYARLFPEMEYVSGANAILSWQKGTKSMGVLAADLPPEGFLTSRMDFIGRARSIWTPRSLETFNFEEARDTSPYPTFDPIGSLLINMKLAPKGTETLRLMIGYGKNKSSALDLVKEFLKPRAINPKPEADIKKSPLIGHGEIPSGTPQPYSEYQENGNKLLVRTPYTTRPYDHALSNAMGHSVMVTNRGLHTSCNGNSQQNRLTPDWPDTVTKEIPTEAIYLYDIDRNEWYSPTHHPLNETDAKNEAGFSVDGTAVFKMSHRAISTELTVFVPPEDPLGVYLLKVKNNSSAPKRMRVAPYFQMVLAFQPEKSGPLQIHHDKVLDALFFQNPRNMFRIGWAFASMSVPADCVETKRGRFFGAERGVKHPYIVEKGEADKSQLTDSAQIAGFVGTLEIPANGEASVAIIMGQADERKEALKLVQKYKNMENVRKSLSDTKKWWLSLMNTASIESNTPEFDRLLNWLKYQAIAERIWPRRGFYQTSGAFGFRDQLQDTVNLMWVDPVLARKQILLAASHQFIEGDVFHWFFTLVDGRTAFSCRSHASDNPLWLPWGVVEYLRATGDESILDEMTSYVISEFPFAKLPKNKGGWGHLYHRATRADSLYKHCMRSINLILNKRTGKKGLPLIQTGDWNDGLDEIGSEGKGESVWLGFFLYYILKDMVEIIGKKEGPKRKEHYLKKMKELESALEATWREDRYLRAFHDDGTEIGIKDSGIWETDALTAAWAVMCNINPERSLTVFNTAINVLERDNAVLLGWPALREDSKPYLGRSSKYPEGVRENGMYCHGVQWLIRASRILAERFEKEGNKKKADEYLETTYRLWRKITPVGHVTPNEIEIYGGQPNKQPADILTNYDLGRMIWNGYTGAAGWLLRQSFEGVAGALVIQNELVLPKDLDRPRGNLRIKRIQRDVSKSPFRSKISAAGDPSETEKKKNRSKKETDLVSSR